MIISNLPKGFAELSYKDEDAAIRLLHLLGEGRKNVEALRKEINLKRSVLVKSWKLN